uniref:Uncharacterized protein n=1 Tax=Panagrolaimus davidi TaxID=227884 RepID=A0A914R082_9BILA
MGAEVVVGKEEVEGSFERRGSGFVRRRRELRRKNLCTAESVSGLIMDDAEVVVGGAATAAGGVGDTKLPCVSSMLESSVVEPFGGGACIAFRVVA